MRRLVFAIASACLWLACGHDYSDTGTPPPDGGGRTTDAGPLTGDRFGKCFSDGTCKVGLSCADGLCLMLDAGDTVPSNGDAAPPGVDGGDAATGPSCVPNALGSPGEIHCADTLCEGTACCINPSQVSCGNVCFDAKMACDSVNDCAGNGMLCCFTLQSAKGTGEQCPRMLVVSSVCSNNCDSDTLAPTCETGPLVAGCASLGRTCQNAIGVLGSTTETVPLRLCLQNP